MELVLTRRKNCRHLVNLFLKEVSIYMSTTAKNTSKQYKLALNLLETEQAIKLAKDTFENKLSNKLNLQRVSAPLFVCAESGLNDDLNGVERPVSFDIKYLGKEYQIVHSLAKWKRFALKKYGIRSGNGLYTDMNAIRRDEELDNLHSVYVDQWDWEKSICKEDRNFDYLMEVVNGIISSLCETQDVLCNKFPGLSKVISKKVFFITSQELENMYPELSPKERENRITKEHKTVFISQIGGKLKSGNPHDLRAPDYDDWSLNGDILVWYPILDSAVELSSMGIRVDSEALERQLEIAGCTDRRELQFHKMLLNDELPLSIGGGIGQSRICMVLLNKAHIGEVQASAWSDDIVKDCVSNSIELL